jgi:hypothetical protein
MKAAFERRQEGNLVDHIKFVLILVGFWASLILMYRTEFKTAYVCTVWLWISLLILLARASKTMAIMEHFALMTSTKVFQQQDGEDAGFHIKTFVPHRCTLSI